MTATRARLVSLVALSLGACFFAFFSIDRRSMWLDEAHSVFTGLRPFLDVVAGDPQGDSSPPLYYVVLSLWMRAFGISEVAVRSLSGVFFLLALGGMYVLVTTLFGDKRAGVIAAILYMTSPPAVRHAHSARMHSLLGLEVILSLTLFYRLFFLDAPESRRRDALLYALVNALGMFTHNWFHFALAAQGLAFLVFVFPRKIREASVVYVLSVLPYAVLWLPAGLTQLDRSALSWIARPTFSGDFVLSFLDFFGGRRLGGMVFGAVALLLLASAKARAAARSRVVLSLFFVSVVSLAIPFLISQYRPIFVTGRYTIIALPPFVAGLSHVLWTSGYRRLLAACLGALIIGSGWGLLARRLPEEVGSDRRAAEDLMRHGRPGDVMIYNGLAMPAIEYYFLLNRRRGDFVALTFPQEHASHPAWMDVAAMRGRKKELADEAEGLAQHLDVTLAPGQRLWVFRGGSDKEITDLLSTRLEGRFLLEEARPISGLLPREILVFRKPETSARP